MLVEEIKKQLEIALLSQGIQDPDCKLTEPAAHEHGDYATSVALKHAKKLGLTPIELAKKIADSTPLGLYIEKIEIRAPGFINFFLSKSALLTLLNKNDNTGSIKSGKVILLEFGQPNTHKKPHIGHLFSYIYGESLARILEKNGHTITRLNYQGDVGLHVAKCLYAYIKNKMDFSDKSLDEKVSYLQLCYQEGSKAYEEDAAAKDVINVINGKIYQKDSDIQELWAKTRGWSVDYYSQFEKNLGIKYDRYYFESQIAEFGKEIVTNATGTVFEKSEGAVIFKGEKYGLHTRVFINKLGYPTYEAKDIGLIAEKKKDYHFDFSLVTTATEQNEYWKVITRVTTLLYPELENKIKHLGFGMINLSTGKMSSRTGHIIDAFSLVKMVQDEIKKNYPQDDATINIIALSSIKYAFLKSESIKDKNFDIKTSIAHEGDSGPYLLYTYVRTRSIINKSQIVSTPIPENIDLNPEEENLLRIICHYEEVIINAGVSYSPHLVAHYIFTLAKEFNFFYQKHSITKAEEGKNALRTQMTLKIGEIIKDGLYLMGIDTVDKM